MKYQANDEKDLAQIISFLALIFHNKDNYHLISKDNYRMVNKNGVLLPENHDLKRFWLMMIGLSGWKNIYSFIQKHAGSGGFLVHFGKDSSHFATNYNLSLPVKMMAIKVGNVEFLTSYYLSLRDKKDEYLEGINQELKLFVNKIDKGIVKNCQKDGEKMNEVDAKLLVEELLKTISPIFESIWYQHRKHFVDAGEFKNFQLDSGKELDEINKKLIELDHQAKNNDLNLKVLENRIFELEKSFHLRDETITEIVRKLYSEHSVRDIDLDLIKQKSNGLEKDLKKKSKEIEKLFSLIPKQKKEPLKEKIYSSPNFTWMADLVRKHMLY